MKIFLLMVLFSSPENPHPHQGDGFAPRIAPTMEACISRRDRLTQYLADNVKVGIKFTAFCVEVEARGYNEAVDAFRQQIGEQL